MRTFTITNYDQLKHFKKELSEGWCGKCDEWTIWMEVGFNGDLVCLGCER